MQLYHKLQYFILNTSITIFYIYFYHCIKFRTIYFFLRSFLWISLALVLNTMIFTNFDVWNSLCIYLFFGFLPVQTKIIWPLNWLWQAAVDHVMSAMMIGRRESVSRLNEFWKALCNEQNVRKAFHSGIFCRVSNSK